MPARRRRHPVPVAYRQCVRWVRQPRFPALRGPAVLRWPIGGPPDRPVLTCEVHAQHAIGMVAVQLRDVPDEVHRELKVRAARAGQSLSEYALAVLTEHTATPTLAEIADRIAHRTAVEPTTSVDELIRDERDSRSA